MRADGTWKEEAQIVKQARQGEEREDFKPSRMAGFKGEQSMLASAAVPAQAVHGTFADHTLDLICVREKHLILRLHRNHGWAP